jgi:hypothetical protein
MLGVEGSSGKNHKLQTTNNFNEPNERMAKNARRDVSVIRPFGIGVYL